MGWKLEVYVLLLKCKEFISVWMLYFILRKLLLSFPNLLNFTMRFTTAVVNVGDLVLIKTNCQLLPFGIAGQPFNQMFCSMPNIQSNMLSPKFPLGKWHHISAICVHFNLQPTRRKKKCCSLNWDQLFESWDESQLSKVKVVLKTLLKKKKKKVVLKTN